MGGNNKRLTHASTYSIPLLSFQFGFYTRGSCKIRKSYFNILVLPYNLSDSRKLVRNFSLSFNFAGTATPIGGELYETTDDYVVPAATFSDGDTFLTELNGSPTNREWKQKFKVFLFVNVTLNVKMCKPNEDSIVFMCFILLFFFSLD